MRGNRMDMGGNASLALALLVYVVLSLTAYNYGVHLVAPSVGGICLPPPSQWGLQPFISLALNMLLIIGGAFWMININRRFNFIPSTSIIYASLFFFMAVGSPVLANGLNTSTLLLIANLAAMQLLFGEYGRSNPAPEPLFVLGTIFSIGSMVHYSFLFFIVVYACVAVLLKVMQIRQIVALIIGVIAPYWILLGTGLVPVQSLHIPTPGVVWMSELPGIEMLWPILTVGLTAFWGLMVALRNAFTLFSASTAIRAYNYALSLPALTCVVLLLIDWENFMVYYLPLSMFVALQAGYMSVTAHKPAAMVTYWCVGAVYVSLCFISLFYV